MRPGVEVALDELNEEARGRALTRVTVQIGQAQLA